MVSIKSRIPNIYYAIGIMSGTSLDGLDLAYCMFTQGAKGWDFEIQKAKTIPYTAYWQEKLANIERKSGLELVKCDMELGHFIGKEVQQFISESDLKPDFIASHGHTVFHRPDEGYTTQIGNGFAVRSYVEVPVIFDFRTLDVALGGQGAPLVPIGDKLLFSSFDYCLNLGGISNISYQQDGTRLAYDISIGNMALNYLTNLIEEPYDSEGSIASSGKINTELFHSLNALSYYHTSPPKSLGKEWFSEEFLPVLTASPLPVPSLLRTVTEHIAYQISKSLGNQAVGTLIITGGGAFNTFLVDRIRNLIPHQVYIPDSLLVNYKEALIFAFLGLLKGVGEMNTLASVTGAKKSSGGGCIV